MKPPRPTGVAILAILDIVVGILALLGGIFIAALGGSGLLALYGYGFFNGFVAVVGGFIIVIGILAIIVGWGMWSGKEWAWLLAIILYGLGALSGLLSLAGGNLSSVVGLPIDVLLLWYMFRPHVKAFFGRGWEPSLLRRCSLLLRPWPKLSLQDLSKYFFNGSQ